MPADLPDLIYARRMRVDHGDRAGQALADVMQAALRNGDDGTARRAERALRAMPVDRAVSSTVVP